MDFNIKITIDTMGSKVEELSDTLRAELAKAFDIASCHIAPAIVIESKEKKPAPPADQADRDFTAILSRINPLFPWSNSRPFPSYEDLLKASLPVVATGTKLTEKDLWELGKHGKRAIFRPLVGNEETLGAQAFYISEILDEYERAQKKFPGWPTSRDSEKDDILMAASIVAEESGELIRAALQWKNEGGSLEAVKKEAIQTATVALRLLVNLPTNNDK